MDIFFKQGGSFSIIHCEVQQVYYAKIYLNDSSMSAFNNLQSAMLKTEKITFKKHRRLRSEPTVVESSYLSGQALRGPQWFLSTPPSSNPLSIQIPLWSGRLQPECYWLRAYNVSLPPVLALSSSPDVHLLLVMKRQALDQHKEPFQLWHNIQQLESISRFMSRFLKHLDICHVFRTEIISVPVKKKEKRKKSCGLYPNKKN